jgi:hypothetical protein
MQLLECKRRLALKALPICFVDRFNLGNYGSARPSIWVSRSGRSRATTSMTRSFTVGLVAMLFLDVAYGG